MNSFTFRVIPLGARTLSGQEYCEVVPVVDGTLLTDAIHRFELEHGMEAREISYRGLVSQQNAFGPARSHYYGVPRSSGREPGKIPVLDCRCGNSGCWPLNALVTVTDDRVMWSEFEQPWRKERDYSAVGPFTFARADYDKAIDGIASIWRAC